MIMMMMMMMTSSRIIKITIIITHKGKQLVTNKRWKHGARFLNTVVEHQADAVAIT